ncbi:hypothetical protein [Haladaptatus cibarius]|uniref:hypothetical protein n=1 Tax=Haladaptatus cibarius TaxID=453847 RepID=UPI001185D52F|nr:hypothetical protein [Haladaptatus cibarius]
MGRDNWTRRSALRYFGLGIAALGGCVSGESDQQAEQNGKSDDETGTTETETETTSDETGDSDETEDSNTEDGVSPSDTHPVLLAVSSYASSEHTVTVTATEGRSSVLDETITLPINDAVTFEDALAVPSQGSVEYEISVSIQGGTTATETFTIKSSHDVHGISAVVMSVDNIRWGTNAH